LTLSNNSSCKTSFLNNCLYTNAILHSLSERVSTTKFNRDPEDGVGGKAVKNSVRELRKEGGYLFLFIYSK
jgi:hypothetical protein